MVPALCDRLVANDAALTTLVILLKDTNDAELKLILDAAKKNKTVKKVRLRGPPDVRSLSVPAALSLASAVSEHPEIQDIEFFSVSFIEFGPIALAIRQNRNLTRLVFESCELTPNLEECIRWLLTENTLESMTLKYNWCRDERSFFDISGALLGNSSVKELVLHDYEYFVHPETFHAIPHLIRTNQDFETIDLLFSYKMTDRYHIVRLVAQAAEGHTSLNKLAIKYPVGNSLEEPSAEDLINHGGTAKAIGTMLHNAPALRELYLTGCYIRSAGARYLADGLSSKNSVVEKLYLSGNKLRAEEAVIFAPVLVANQNLKSLVLHFNNIGDAGALALAVALRQNNTLELLDLLSNDIYSKGASALADALAANGALKDLNLLGNPVGDDGATSIAKMLTRNESVEKVCFGQFSEEGLKALATRLSSMNSLKTLEVGFYSMRGFASEIQNSIVLALEQNMTMETIDFDASPNGLEVMPQVNRLLALNRGGRRLLSAMGASAPPLNYWPRILARSSADTLHNADVLFYFLREIPNVLVAKAGSWKRKRGDHDETTSTMHHT
jgi:Ran GTPase-activating protein (RanGAP) involved in mRNA processing and transport